MSYSRLRPPATAADTVLTAERLAELRAVLPEVFADGQINWDTLRETLAPLLEDESAGAEHFGLFWPGKREARRLAALPSRGALHPAVGEGVNEQTTHNVFIEGDNLEVLKLLLKSYAGRVKMIYIDPPYNTGNDFVYKDDFSEPLEAYLRATGQGDSEGNVLTTNTETSGRYHSAWLSMLYPRLVLARACLSDEGVIFVSIDDHEFHNLRLLMNEVYGDENFLATFVWRRRTPSALADKLVSVDHEYVVAYQKGGFKGFFGVPKDYAGYSNPDNDPNGPWKLDNLTVGMTKDQRPNQFYDLVDPATGRVFPANPNRVWAFIPETMAREIKAGRIVFPDTLDRRPLLKRYKNNLKSDVNPISTWINGLDETSASSDATVLETGLNAQGTRSIQELFGATIFNYAKPISLLASLIKHTTITDDIVMDFFSGSTTTAQAVLERNIEDGGSRRFIMIQFPEPTPNQSTARQAGYRTIADIGKDRLRRVIGKMQAEQASHLLQAHDSAQDLGFRVYKLSPSDVRPWRDYDGEDVATLETLFSGAEQPLVDGWTPANVLTEALLLQGFPLDSALAPDQRLRANAVTRVTSEACAHTLYICLDTRIADETIIAICDGAAHVDATDVFVCLDSALTDEAKLRLADVCNLQTI